jgi:hypothetical protein
MSLPDGSEPLKLADGSLIYPGGEHLAHGNTRDHMIEIPTHREAQRIITDTRRKVADLPAVPKTMNAVGAILTYSMFGMDDEETAIATGLSIEQIGRIKVSDPYSQMYDAVVRRVLDSETDVVRELIAKHARDAAVVMVDGLNSGSRTDRISAAKDILDRSGHRPVDVVEHRHRVDGGLVIEYVRRDDHVAPTIDMGV